MTPRDAYMQLRSPWRDGLLALLVAIVTFGHGMIYANATPAGVPPDEWAHITHIKEVADGRWLPDYAESRVLGSERGNYLGHPPLYYTSLGLLGRAAGWDPVDDLVRYRAVSAVFMALGLLLWVLIARQLRLSWYWTIPLCLSVNAIPMFPYLAGSINNDTLAYLAVAMAMFGVSMIPRLPRAAYYIGAAGLLMALLTKATAGLFLLLFFGIWLGAMLWAGQSPLRNKHFRIAVAITALASGGYYLFSLWQFGALFPRVGEAHTRGGLPADPLSLIAITVESVRQMMSRLPAITSHASTVPLTGLLREMFLLALALPVIAWAWTRLAMRKLHANPFADAFTCALALTLLIHLAVVMRGYHVYGVLSGLQPRYYSFVLPGLFVLCFARHHHSRVATALLAATALIWTGMLLTVPVKALDAEAARHAAPPATSLVNFNNADALSTSAGATFVGRPAGFVDSIHRHNGTAQIRGWAIDAGSLQPAAQVNLYHDGRLLGSAATGRPRPDVARALDDSDAGRSGFTVELTDIPPHVAICDLVLAAQQADGRMAPLHQPPCKRAPVD